MQRALTEARRIYADLAIGDHGIREQFLKRFENGIEMKYQMTKEKKFAEAAADVEALLSRANSDLQKVNQHTILLTIVGITFYTYLVVVYL